MTKSILLFTLVSSSILLSACAALQDKTKNKTVAKETDSLDPAEQIEEGKWGETGCYDYIKLRQNTLESQMGIPKLANELKLIAPTDTQKRLTLQGQLVIFHHQMNNRLNNELEHCVIAQGQSIPEDPALPSKK